MCRPADRATRLATLAAVSWLAIAPASIEVARAEVEDEILTSTEHGFRAELPRGWRVTEHSGYPGVVVWMSRTNPPVKILITADPIADDCRASSRLFCSLDPVQVAAALRAQLAATGFTVTPIEQSRTPEFEYDDGRRYLRQSVVVIGDRVITILLAAASASERLHQGRTFDRLTQSVRALPAAQR